MRSWVCLVFTATLALGTRARAAELDKPEPTPPPPPEWAALGALLEHTPTLIGLDMFSMYGPTVSVHGRGMYRCGGGDVVTATFSDGPPIACMLPDEGDPRCVRAPGARHARTLETAVALCRPARDKRPLPSTVPAPPWIAELAALRHEEHQLTQLEVFARGDAIRARFADDEDDGFARYFVAVRGPKGWRSAEQAFDQCLHPENGPWWVLDASKLAGEPAWALHTTCGDSEGGDAGSFGSRVRVVVERDGLLRTLAEKRIGKRTWLRRDERDRVVSEFWKRPHVELILSPSVTDEGTLELRVARKSIERLGMFCTREEMAARRAGADSDCPLPALDELQQAAGSWRLEAGAWVRAPRDGTRAR